MPYKCVHCSKLYEDGSEQVLKGCDGCGRKFFFYIRKDQVDKIRENEELDVELDAVEKKQIEQDVREISGFEDEEVPVFLDFESVKVIRPGKYAVDLGNLFATNKPRVYKLEDGKYIIDLSTIKISERQT
ncbi:MAG: Zn-ribbon domain-containing protein [Nanoarchaeota archaeon]|nr:Zn-ribbon domain-containing protein [Nanoarchaeota archaeon]MBU1103822.1 Zn-ribbon domain-containing protein [Nanoarchaeota archaeon]